MILAFNGNGQPIAHSEHAQINPLVLVELLIESIQSLGVDVTGGRVHDLSAPQHLQIQSQQSFFIFSSCSQSKHAVGLSVPQHVFSDAYSTRLREVYLRCQLQWCPLFVGAQGTSHSICRSWLYQRRWTQSCMFQLPQPLSVHLMRWRGKLKCKSDWVHFY